MKDFWKKILSEKVSSQHRNQVLNQAKTELKRNFKPTITWRLAFSLGVAVASMCAIWIYQNPMEFDYSQGNINAAFLEIEPDEVEDYEIISELDLLEDLEVLEQWSAI